MRLVILLAITVVGCSDAEPTTMSSQAAALPTESALVFAGVLPRNVFAASVWQQGRAAVYTCGVDESLQDSTSWLAGDPQGAQLELTQGPFHVAAQLVNGAVMGRWSNGDTDEALLLEEVTDPTKTGLFMLTEGDCRTAAIALPRGGKLMIQGAHSCDGSGEVFQVTPVRKPTLLYDQVTVRFDDGAGSREVELDRLSSF